MAFEPKSQPRPTPTPQKRPLHRDTDEIRVIIYIQDFKVIGTIKVPVGGRLTDFLNKSLGGKSKDTFLAITNAECYYEKDDKLRYSSEFVTIHRDHIHMILPTSKILDARSHSRTPNPNIPQKP